MDQYDICIDINLRVWDGQAMSPISCSFVRFGHIDDLAGADIKVDQAVAMARKMLEWKSATMIRDLAAAILHMRHEQPVLPFP